MKASPPPIPFDQPCLVALHILYAMGSSHHTAMAPPSSTMVVPLISTYTKIFLYPTLEFAQCRMLLDDDLLKHGARHKNSLRTDSIEAGVQRRCDSSKG